jgi:hypothetical protein
VSFGSTTAKRASGGWRQRQTLKQNLSTYFAAFGIFEGGPFTAE